MRHVALLRGINVGSAKRVGMAALQAAFTEAGYTDARTVLQSGNVVFTSPRRLAPKAVRDLEVAVRMRTGVSSRILVLDAAQLRRIVEGNPLLAHATDLSRLHVTFVQSGTDPRGVPLPSPTAIAPDVLHVTAQAVYLWAPDGQAQSRVPASFWRTFGDDATQRNWRTVMRILALLES